MALHLDSFNSIVSDSQWLQQHSFSEGYPRPTSFNIKASPRLALDPGHLNT